MKKIKLFRKAAVVLLCFALVLGASFSAVAAEPQTAGDIFAEVDDKLRSESEVSVTLLNDITDTVYLNIPEGKTVNISGEYTLNGIYVSGKGTLNVDVKAIYATNSSALNVNGAVTVNVTVSDGIRVKDIVSAYSAEDQYWFGSASDTISLFDDETGGPTVTVTGDVWGANATLPAEAMQNGDSYADGGNAIKITGSAKLKVKGNLYGGNSAGAYAYGGDGISYDIYEESIIDVTVEGNITGGNVTADPEVEGDRSIGGYGIDADIYTEDTSSAKININVTGDIKGGNTQGRSGYAGDGINAAYSNITVTGNVTAGDASAEASYGGYGIYVDDSTVNVTGNVKAGSSSGKEGFGGVAIAAYAGKVTVKGDAIGGNATGTDGKGGFGIYGQIYAEDYESGDEEIEVATIYVDGTVYGGKGKDGAAVGYETYGIDALTPLEDMIVDHDKLIGDGAAKDYITDLVAGFLAPMAAHQEVITKDEANGIITNYYKYLADKLNVTVSDSFKAEYDFAPDASKLIIETAEVKAVNNAMDALSAQEQGQISGEYSKTIVDEYNAAVTKNYDVSDVAENTIATDITVWELSNENSDYYYFYNEDFSAEEQAALNKSVVKYIVKVSEAQNGTVTVDAETVKEGGLINIAATAADGYTLDKLSVSGQALEGTTYTAKLGGAIIVEGSFKALSKQDTTNNNVNAGGVSGGDTSLTSPKTEDNISVELCVALLMMAFAAAFVIYRKNRYNA